MFSGRYDYAIDDKSRVSIPARYRDVLSANYDLRLVLTNVQYCIVAYPHQEWLDEQQRLLKQPLPTPAHRNYLRFYFSGAFECPIDRLGRILVPQSLKNHAGIRKNVTFVGVTNKIEIWAQEKWEEQMEMFTSDPEQMAQIQSDLGL